MATEDDWRLKMMTIENDKWKTTAQCSGRPQPELPAWVWTWSRCSAMLRGVQGTGGSCKGQGHMGYKVYKGYKGYKGQVSGWSCHQIDEDEAAADDNSLV